MANYPKCPKCGATGPVGASMPNCACFYPNHTADQLRTRPSEGDVERVAMALANELAQLIVGIGDTRVVARQLYREVK